MKVLVVDDELVSRKKMRKIIEGFAECIDVEDGKTTIETFIKVQKSETPFDAMTLDIELPDMSGVEILTKIRGIEDENNVEADERIKILMVTSRSDKKTVMECIKAKCSDYVLKPFDKESVYKKFNQMGFKIEEK